MKDDKTIAEMALHSKENWGFHVKWRYSGYYADAEVREVTGTDMGETEIYYGECSVLTTNPEEVAPTFTMMVKWDGCSHFRLPEDGYTHLCGAYHIKKFLDVIQWTYIRAQELMVKEGGTILEGEEWSELDKP